MGNISDWIQAGAAVVQASAAIVILLVAREYVQLTKQLADASSEQLRLARLDRLAQDKQQAMIVASRAESLLKRVDALPPWIQGAGVDRVIRQAALWTPSEVDALHTAAAGLLAMAGVAAARAASAMTWLLDRAREVRDAKPEFGFDYSCISNDDWGSRRADASIALKELVAYGTIMRDTMDDLARQIPIARDT